MKRLMLMATIGAAAGLAGVAAADDDTGAFYVSPMAQWWHLDENRDAKSGPAGQLGLGYNFAPNWAAELEFAGGRFTSHETDEKLTLLRYSVDFIRKWMPDSTVHPYVLFGGGGFHDRLSGYPTTDQFAGEVGTGLLFDLGPKIGSTRWQGRAEVKYQHEFNDVTASSNDVGDWVFGVGVQYSFGIPNPPPPPAPAPPPPPPPPVVAAPPPPPAPVDGDDDGDGVPNSIDKCPNTPKGDKVDAYGCTITDEIKLEGVNFATASADLLPEADYVLQYAVKTLKKHPELVVEIAGYTDSRGSAPYNLTLSQHRAESVLKYLQDHGVTNTLRAKGYGKEHPIASNETKDGQLENRRVTMRILSGLH